MAENTDKTKDQAQADSEEALNDEELDGVAGGASTKLSANATIKTTNIKTTNVKVSPIVGVKPVAMEHSCSDEKG